MALIQWRWLLLPYCITTATVWPLSPLTFHFPHPAIASNARTSVANCVHCSRSSFQRRGSCNIRTMSCLKIVTHFVKWSRFSSEISLILSASPRGEIWQTTWRCKLAASVFLLGWPWPTFTVFSIITPQHPRSRHHTFSLPHRLVQILIDYFSREWVLSVCLFVFYSVPI